MEIKNRSHLKAALLEQKFPRIRPDQTTTTTPSLQLPQNHSPLSVSPPSPLFFDNSSSTFEPMKEREKETELQDSDPKTHKRSKREGCNQWWPSFQVPLFLYPSSLRSTSLLNQMLLGRWMKQRGGRWMKGSGRGARLESRDSRGTGREDDGWSGVNSSRALAQARRLHFFLCKLK